MERLETPRVLLRPFVPEDREIVYRISADPDTTKYLCHFGNAGSTPDADTDRFLSRSVAAWRETPVRAREYALMLKETGEVMGDGSIELLDDEGFCAEIGWILLPGFRGKGYAAEMGRELVRFGFETLSVRRIIAHCDVRNIPSRRVMERLHMRLSGIEPAARPAKEPGGPMGDEATYEIFREDWEG